MDFKQHWYQFKLDANRNIKIWLKNEMSSPRNSKTFDVKHYYSIIPSYGKKDQYWGHLVNVQMTQALEKYPGLNWWPKGTRLLAVNVKDDESESSLFNSIAICLWGVLDQKNIVRTSMMTSMKDGNFWMRRLAVSSEIQKEMKDPQLLGLGITPFHVFILANILHRPIIVVSDEENVMTSDTFHGIYLPVLSKPIDCNKAPVFLAYYKHRFNPLSIEAAVPTGLFEEKYQIIFPVLKDGVVTLSIRFLECFQETKAGELLQDYLIIKESDIALDETLPTVAYLQAELKPLPEDRNTMLEFINKFHHNPDMLIPKEQIPGSPEDAELYILQKSNMSESLTKGSPGYQRASSLKGLENDVRLEMPTSMIIGRNKISLSDEGQKLVTLESKGNPSTSNNATSLVRQNEACFIPVDNINRIDHNNAIFQRLVSVADQEYKLKQFLSKSTPSPESEKETLSKNETKTYVNRSKSWDCIAREKKHTLDCTYPSKWIGNSSGVLTDGLEVQVTLCAGPTCSSQVKPPEKLCERCVRILKVHSFSKCDKICCNYSVNENISSDFHHAGGSGARSTSRLTSYFTPSKEVPPGVCGSFVNALHTDLDARGSFYNQAKPEPQNLKVHDLPIGEWLVDNVIQSTNVQVIHSDPKLCFTTLDDVEKDNTDNTVQAVYLPDLHLKEEFEEDPSARSCLVTSMTSHNDTDEQFGGHEPFDFKFLELENSFSKQKVKCKTRQCSNYGNKDKGYFCNVCFSVKEEFKNQENSTDIFSS